MAHLTLDLTGLRLRGISKIEVTADKIVRQTKKIGGIPAEKKEKTSAEPRRPPTIQSERERLATVAMFVLSGTTSLDELPSDSALYDRLRIKANTKNDPAAETQLTRFAAFLSKKNRCAVGEIALSKGDPVRLVAVQMTEEGLEARRFVFADEYSPDPDTKLVEDVQSFLYTAEGRRFVQQAAKRSRRFRGDLLKMITERPHPLRQLQRERVEKETLAGLRTTS